MSASATMAGLSLGLFVGMLACLEIGYLIGHRRSRIDSSAHQGIGAIEAAIFALLGLLLGFAFAGAMSRLEARRELIVREANAIGTAYLRIDLLPAPDQAEMRRLFRTYLEARLRVYERLEDREATDRAIAQAAGLQQRIWADAVAASQRDLTRNIARIVLPALNEMIDVTTARTVALKTRLPSLILDLITVVALLSALLAGYAMAERKGRSLLHMILYGAAVSMTVYAVLDLDNPRAGLIRLDATDRVGAARAARLHPITDRDQRPIPAKHALG